MNTSLQPKVGNIEYESKKNKVEIKKLNPPLLPANPLANPLNFS